MPPIQPNPAANMAAFDAARRAREAKQAAGATTTKAAPPSERAVAITQAAPLVLWGVASAFGGAALATRIALPKYVARTAFIGLTTSNGINRTAQTSSLDTTQNPAGPVARAFYVTVGFASLGAAVAALANKALHIYPPRAAWAATAGVAVALLPMVFAAPSSPLWSRRVQAWFEHYADDAERLYQVSRWPFYSVMAASVLAGAGLLPGAPLLAVAAAVIGTIRTSAEVTSLLGRRQFDGHLGPTESALSMQRPLAWGALVGIFVGTAAWRR